MKLVINSKWKIPYTVLTCVFLVMGIGGNVALARMPGDTLAVKVYYPCGSSDVSKIPANAPCLERFIHDLDSLCSLPFFKPFALTITSSASPEGSIGRNRALSHARAMSVLDFLNGRSETFRHISSSLDCSIDEQTTNHMAGQVKSLHYSKMRFSEVMLRYSQGEDSLQAVSPPVAEDVSNQGQAEAPVDSVRTVGLPAEEMGDITAQLPPRQGGAWLRLSAGPCSSLRPTWHMTCSHSSTWAGVPTKKQAKTIVDNLPRLEYPCGVVACEKGPRNRAYQWDYPNAWASFNVLPIAGLDRYGYNADASRIARKYVDSITSIYLTTGNLWEKFNGELGNLDINKEYEMPPFMGWTAGAFIFASDYLRTH